MTPGRRRAKGRAEIAARAAVVALGLPVGGCTALLGVTDVTEAVDASDGGGGPGVSGDAAAADGTFAHGRDAGADPTTNPSADGALDSTMGSRADAAVGASDGEVGPEAAMPDAGDGGRPVEAGGCAPTDLRCDGGCVPNDTHHCGTCGNDCTALKNVSGTVSCVSGVCSFSCNSGWAHCPDAGAAVGCETDLSMAANCGACGHLCPSGTPMCSGSGFTCVNGCPPDAPTLCGTNTCVDTTSSAGHCGSCTNACSTADPHAQTACVGRACTVTCNTGYTSCPTGCVDEQTDNANCGGCGTACTGATSVCLNKACVACKPTLTQCSGAVPQTCDASGAWQSSPVTAGQCRAVCTPGAMQCSGNPSNSVQTCGPDGQWGSPVGCMPSAPSCVGQGMCASYAADANDASGATDAALIRDPRLGSAARFAVFAGATVTNAFATTITGDLGTYPATTAVGTTPPVVVGAFQLGNLVAQAAAGDISTAYTGLTPASMPGCTSLTGQDLGGKTLAPGIYCFSTSAQLTGALVLDAANNPNAEWFFQIRSTLTTGALGATPASVTVINGGNRCNAFWQVGSAATLGTGTVFSGNILAWAGITLVTGTTVVGRTFAVNGAVSMDHEHRLHSDLSLTLRARVAYPTRNVYCAGVQCTPRRVPDNSRPPAPLVDPDPRPTLVSALIHAVEEVARARGVLGYRVGYKRNAQGEHVVAIVFPPQPP